MNTRWMAYLTISAWLLMAGIARSDEARTTWIAASDETQVERTGEWRKTSFRYAHASHLQTTAGDAALSLRFRGTGIGIRLANNASPAYGTPNLGRLVVQVDDGKPIVIEPRSDALEFVAARQLAAGEHRLRVTHQSREDGNGCRIEGFRVVDRPSGDLAWSLNAEDNAFLVEARAVLRKGDLVLRNSLVRNWLSGRCRLVGLPVGDGYSLTISASGWRTVVVRDVRITSGQTTTLPGLYLKRDPATRNTGFRFPALNRPAIGKPGQSFRARLNAYRMEIDRVELRRTVGPAVISRSLPFEVDTSSAFYYDQEVVVQLPPSTPPGLYDLSVTASNKSGRRSIQRSPRSVHVVSAFPNDPVLVTFGHLDTSSQYQAEYLERLATMANLIGPDFVLNSNAVNPAYISGALSKLDTPYMITFGNHRFHGHQKWYGDQVGLLDFGPDIAVLNFGHPWHVDKSKAESLFLSRKSVPCKIINAFEQNAPVDFLDRHGVRMIHDAHGTGPRVANYGKTPTVRVGKVNATSFRVVRFKNGHVDSCTYNGGETEPIPFGREQAPPLRSTITPANDGLHEILKATITNEYLDAFPNCRLTFVAPVGDYEVLCGRLETNITSDDRRFAVLTVRCDVPAERVSHVEVRRK